jgi:restriction endonuclease S subunit
MPKELLGNHIEKISIKASDLDSFSNLEVFGVSNKDGIVKTNHVKSKDLSKYLYIEENYFAYNPYRINVGSIGLTPKGIKGLVSPAYIVFKTKDTLKAELLFDFLKSFDGLQQINKLARGTVRKALRYDDLCKIEINVPSIKKQEKILLLKKNTKLYVDDVKNEIQTQQTLLKKLRQSILQEAIEGKLSAEWRAEHPDVEPASVLLEKIRAEKERLVKEKKIKKQKPLSPIRDEEKPFEIPETWEWCRLGDTSIVGTGATPSTSNTEYYKNGTINWITSSATGNDYVYEAENKITQKAIDETNCNLNPIGTLVIAMYGQGKTRGQITELMIEAATNQACATINPYLTDKVLSQFIKKYFKKIYLDIRKLAAGGAQPNLNMTKIKNTILPLPPLKEQKEIVKKIESLFKICDALEEQIEQAKADSEMLMQAILREAFEG